ncbi:MAG: chemotaxis protein CheW [Planctomycetes bacterium]|nr:chemotaxis protein CheW [Planctomycetota bacterium]
MEQHVHISESLRNDATEFGDFLTAFSFKKTKGGISINIVGCMELLELKERADCIRGVIYLHRQTVPVIDLQKKLGLGATKISSEGCILLTEGRSGDDCQVGIIVEDMADVLAIVGKDVEELRSRASNHYDCSSSATRKYFNLADALMDMDEIIDEIKLEEFQGT